jgi:chorismate mutase/prephenate dehydrogenase
MSDEFDGLSLDALRERLVAIDRQLFSAVAERDRLIRHVESRKARDAQPRFDRARERASFERARRLAAELDLDPRLAEQVLEVVIAHAHRDADAHRASLRSPEARKLLIVGGGGAMGQRFVQVFRARGHEVEVLEANDPRDRPSLIAAADVVMLAVPMALAEQLAAQVAPHVRPDALLCDINSLKEAVCATMAAACPGEVLGLHPMFGPTVGSFTGQKVVVCEVRAGRHAAWLVGELAHLGMECIHATPAEHDRMMSVVQVLMHFSTVVMGEALRRSGVQLEDSLRYTSPIYRLELAFVGRLFAQDPDLYAEIEMSNPRGDAVRLSFLRAAADVAEMVHQGDRAAFRELFGRVSRWFHGFDDEAMRLSDMVIDRLVARP